MRWCRTGLCYCYNNLYVIILCITISIMCIFYNMLEGYFHVCEFEFTQITTGEIQLSTTLPFLQTIYAVVANLSAIPVIPSSYRLVSGQRASTKTVPPPRDRLSLVGQNELVSCGLYRTSSSTLLSRNKRLALAVTLVTKNIVACTWRENKTKE